VGRWGTPEDFARQRTESGQWVFWRDRVELVLAGRYHDVMPLHVEVSPTFLCNFACPWCSCRSAREEWAEDDVFHHPRSTPLTVMRRPRIGAVVEHLAEHNIEIMWVGGEPTMNPLLYPAAARGHELGVNQCLFTNGSLFTKDQATTLFDANLVFIRVSLNAVTPEIHQRHHDYDPRRRHGERVIANLSMLAELRAQQRSQTLLGVSIVVDRHNIGDMEETACFLAGLAEEHGTRCVDYVMLRPAFPLTGAQIDVDAALVEQFTAQSAPGSRARAMLESAGVDVVVPEASLTAAQPLDEDDIGCLAAGWFGEVTPSGDMLPCSDLYGDPEYYIGNVADQTVGEIWAGQTRRAVLENVRAQKCPATRCPSNGRGYQLNRVFRDIERFRTAGQLDKVRTWAADLRTVLPEPTHSFFL
jgi:radical SAM protein with 4Fe4S-binding SPASM domain